MSDSHFNVIRRIDRTGTITTIAGALASPPAFSGDGGPAVAARLSYPGTLQLDRWGNLYVVDSGNGRVRKIDTAGVITTVAGSGSPDGVTRRSGDGVGGPATKASLWPSGVAVDPRGNVFVSDSRRVYKIDTDGMLTAVGGDGTSGFRGDGGPALATPMTYPRSLAVDGSGNVLVAEEGNHRVRRISGVADTGPPGPVKGWGWNILGQVGGNAPHLVAPSPTGTPEGFNDVAAGAYHSLGLRADGSVWGWGSNGLGQLGDGTATDRRTPSRIGGTALAGVTDIAAGAYHNLARRSDGTVWSWGWNGLGQLGDGTTAPRSGPVRVPGLTAVTAVAAGGFHSVALRDDGTVWAWGWNGFGQVGDGGTTQRNVPVQVPGLTDVAAVSAGAYHSLALRSDGSVWAWGFNGFGGLGDGTSAERHLPVRVSGLSGVVAISAGAYHNLAMRADGTVWAWGFNRFGQVGDGTVAERRTPVRVPGADGARALRAGWFHNVLRAASGAVLTWGLNHAGQLGDGTLAERHQPVAVSGVRADAVSAGAFHSLLT